MKYERTSSNACTLGQADSFQKYQIKLHIQYRMSKAAESLKPAWSSASSQWQNEGSQIRSNAKSKYK
jgi:hypothetical protein